METLDFPVLALYVNPSFVIFHFVGCHTVKHAKDTFLWLFLQPAEKYRLMSVCDNETQ